MTKNALQWNALVDEAKQVAWDAVAVADTLQARIDVAKALHQPDELRKPGFPQGCLECLCEDWPCPTYRILSGETE